MKNELKPHINNDSNLHGMTMEGISLLILSQNLTIRSVKKCYGCLREKEYGLIVNLKINKYRLFIWFFCMIDDKKTIHLFKED